MSYILGQKELNVSDSYLDCNYFVIFCGKIGHYCNSCSENVNKIAVENMNFGSWIEEADDVDSKLFEQVMNPVHTRW